jgi:branched-chain amino acid transport system ATP-binding protein
MSLLALDQVRKSFGGLVAVRDVSFAIDPGEILGLMGANGAGKTTIFNLISGVMRPSAGRITFEGARIDGSRPDRVASRGIARTYQIVRPFAGMTVLENVMVGALYGTRRRQSLADAAKEAEAIIGQLGIAARGDQLASSLTLAGRKRLEIGRALALSPRLLLLDEVLAGLTPTEVASSLEMLRAIHATRGLAMIIIEHNMRALMALCSRIVVVHHGERIAEGTPAEVTRDGAVIEAYLGAAP